MKILSKKRKYSEEIAQQVDPNAEIHALYGGMAYYLPEGSENPIFQRISQLCTQHDMETLPAYPEADIYFRKYHVPIIILGPGNITEARSSTGVYFDRTPYNGGQNLPTNP